MRSMPCTDHGGLGGPRPRAISGGVLTDVAISLSTYREWLVNENSVKRTGSTGCRSLGWYYALTPVKPVTISNEHCS